MKISTLHRFLGLAEIYAILKQNHQWNCEQDRRLARQEKRMETIESKIARIEGLTTTLGTEIKAAVAKLSAAPVSTDDSAVLDRLDKIGDLLSGDVADLSASDAVNAGLAPGGQTPGASIPSTADGGSTPAPTDVPPTADGA